MANENLVQRTAVGSFALTNAAATIGSGEFIPAGAIITGIRIASPDAVTITGASQTVVPKAGTQALAATVNVSDLPAQTVPQIFTLGTTDGKYIGASGSFNVIVSATGTGAATCPGVTGDYNFYVDYIVPVS